MLTARLKLTIYTQGKDHAVGQFTVWRTTVYETTVY